MNGLLLGVLKPQGACRYFGLDAGKRIAVAAHASQYCGAAVDSRPFLTLHGLDDGARRDKRDLGNAEPPGTHGPAPDIMI
jgi:hypothetical protein